MIVAKSAYLVLARKYRPKSFEEVVGQDAVVQTLRNAVQSHHVGQAYLFAGPRGVGKTTMARLLAKSLNCLKSDEPTATACNKCDVCVAVSTGDDIDVLEIDGASNRKVEESRDLRETVQYAPARGRYKIYIIDEVHMLTTEAFNTLLKTLEEPPEKVKFIFATTQPYKVPETILSRCQRLDFRRIPTRLIAEELGRIAKTEKLSVEPQALGVIARAARGGMRDALSLLDLLLAQGKKKITVEDMNAILGFIGEESRFALSASLKAGDLKGALQVFHNALEQGTDVGQFLEQTLEHFRALLLVKSCGRDAPGLDELAETLEQLDQQAKEFSLDAILYAIQILTDTAAKIRTSTQARALVELALIKLSRLQDVQPMGELLTRLVRLEQALRGGAPLGASRSGAPSRGPVSSAPADQSAAPQIRSPGGPWGQILQCLEIKKRTLAVLLEGNCRPLQMQEGRVVLGLPRSAAFHKAMVEAPENLALIESCAEQVFGKPCKVSIELTSSFASDAEAAGPSVPTEEAGSDEGEAVPEAAPIPSAPPGAEEMPADLAERVRAEEARAEQIRRKEQEIQKVQEDPVIQKTLKAFQGTITGIGE